MALERLTEGGSDGGASRERRWLALALLSVVQFMVVLDTAIVNVALPSIQTELGFSQGNLQWILTAYAIFFGGFLLLGGRLSDYLGGRRRLFMIGLTLFSFASLMCGFAWSELSLIVFRSLQGLGGALLSPAALAILVTTYREGPDRNLALGVWGGVAGSGAAAGTLLGGLLTSRPGVAVDLLRQRADWRCPGRADAVAYSSRRQGDAEGQLRRFRRGHRDRRADGARLRPDAGGHPDWLGRLGADHHIAGRLGSAPDRLRHHRVAVPENPILPLAACYACPRRGCPTSSSLPRWRRGSSPSSSCSPCTCSRCSGTAPCGTGVAYLSDRGHRDRLVDRGVAVSSRGSASKPVLVTGIGLLRARADLCFTQVLGRRLVRRPTCCPGSW